MRRTASTTAGQLLRAMGASLVAFAVDFGTLALLTEAARLHYLVSAGISFLLGNSVVYLLSVRWVFPERRFASRPVEYALFVMVGTVGLGLNELLLWTFTDRLGIFYLASKAIAACLIFFWNFAARKYLLFRAPRRPADS
jgi:putative flippase GtrA